MEKIIEGMLTKPADKIAGHSKELVSIIDYFKTAQAGVLTETSPQNISRKSIQLNGYRSRLGQIVAELGTVYQEARAERKQAWAEAFTIAVMPGEQKNADGSTSKKITTGDFGKARADILTAKQVYAEIKAEELLEKAKALREDIEEALFLFQAHAGNILKENNNSGAIYGSEYKPKPWTTPGKE